MKTGQTGVPKKGPTLAQQESDDAVVVVKNLVCFFSLISILVLLRLYTNRKRVHSWTHLVELKTNSTAAG